MKLSAVRVGKLIWALIYGGLLCVGLGLALQRAGANWDVLVIAGGAAAIVAGVVLIWVRSRMRGPA